jgi:hypothetical protein
MNLLFPSNGAKKYFFMTTMLLLNLPLVGLQAQSDAAREVFPIRVT